MLLLEEEHCCSIIFIARLIGIYRPSSSLWGPLKSLGTTDIDNIHHLGTLLSLPPTEPDADSQLRFPETHPLTAPEVGKSHQLIFLPPTSLHIHPGQCSVLGTLLCLGWTTPQLSQGGVATKAWLFFPNFLERSFGSAAEPSVPWLSASP